MDHKQLMRDVLAETIKYYKYHPERVGIKALEGCTYYGKKGRRRCAIGRMMKHPEKYEGVYKPIGVLVREGHVDIENDLKAPYNQLPIDFLRRLQSLHDVNLSAVYRAGEPEIDVLLHMVAIIKQDYQL